MSKQDTEFESFMQRVNKIGSIIEGLSSNDQTVCDEATKEADLYLNGKIKGNIVEGSCIINHDRTIINKEAFRSETLDQPSASKEAFMSVMSKDAEDRARDKREREARAKKYSKEAEKFIESEDYVSAVYFYNKAIDERVNWPRLFAGRAKVLLELRLFKRAIEDCDKATKLNEDLIFLKGDSCTTQEKKEAELFDVNVEHIKKQALAVHHPE